MDLFVYVFLGSNSLLFIIFETLFIIGAWGMFKKSGVPSWWALIPCAREYMLAACAGREPEGRVTSVVQFILIFVNVSIQLLEAAMSGASERYGMIGLLLILSITLALIRTIYRIRVYIGLIEVYGQKRRWLWLWIPLRFIPALIWGYRAEYQPAWEVEEFRQKLADITNTGSAEVLTDGLTVNLRERTVTEFFNRKIVLQDIHLSIPPGRMVLLLGGSGAGKTVFLNAISGYEKADASVMLGGSDMYRDYKKMQYQVGYAPQQDTMRGKDTIYNTLMDAARLRLPKDASLSLLKARVDTVVDFFGLTPSKTHLVEKLSGGQRKRVSIAMELLSNPALFILDEPDSGLDGVMARELMTQLRAVADQGKIVIVITHTPDRVVDLFDDVIVLAKDDKRIGRLVFYGSIDAAREHFGKDSMEGIVKCVNGKAVEGEGRAEEFIAKFAEVQHA
ncbi:MAG: ABC transporter ATP-binding protein [Oscillospiraceae bacterium]|nr:ABC transporter ATP-binding protein [Oscillospiraceae bacterium]